MKPIENISKKFDKNKLTIQHKIDIYKDLKKQIWIYAYDITQNPFKDDERSRFLIALTQSLKWLQKDIQEQVELDISKPFAAHIKIKK